jgi:outer membrane protein OmpA-like peptidoglycan-associated protein
MQRRVFVVLVFLVLPLVVVGCVTRKFVREQLERSDARIERQLVEVTQELTAVKRLEKLASQQDDERAHLKTEVTEIRALADEAIKRADRASAIASAAMTKAEEAFRATSQPVGNGRTKREVAETAFETIGIVFEFDSWHLDERARMILMKTAKQLQENPSLRVKLEGHTDNVGLRPYNAQLSQRRAEMVGRFLVEKGIAQGRIQSLGVGEVNPVADNKSRSGRDQNRRVTVKLYVPGT